MQLLLRNRRIEYFNPVVGDWNEEAQKRELRERRSCDFCLYAITPRMSGVYSIAEVVDDSNKRPEKTVLVLLREDGTAAFTPAQWNSLIAVEALVISNGAKSAHSLEEAADLMAKA